MTDVIIFGGTAEGRMLSEQLADSGLDVHVCVATEYGESLIEKKKNLTVSHERLGDQGRIELINDNNVKVVIDATHPYAVIISEHVKEACNSTGAEYIRLLRPESSDEGCIVVNDVGSAVEYLKEKEGNILVATGSKELAEFTVLENYKERVFARVLPLPEVVDQCHELGFIGKNLICMQGPFNEDINYGMMKQFDIKYLVTKDSGIHGGFDEKMKAAIRAGAEVIMIGRPPEDGMTYDAVLKEMAKRFNIKIKKPVKKKNKKNVWVIGMGMGGSKGMTLEAAEACKGADVIIGPKRMIGSLGSGKPIFDGFKPDDVIRYIDEHPEFNNIAVVFSGDIGFYSGAKKLVESAKKEWNIIPICGISSVVHLCSRLEIPWQDVKLISAHGIKANIIGEIERNNKVFSLLTKGKDINELCEKLITYGMRDTTIVVGNRLGYPEEKVISGKPKAMMKKEFSDLSVVLVINNKYNKRYPVGIPDREFIRGKVPMTKNEIRTLTVIKLGLSDDSIIYDVGAGTGSVSIEMAKVAVSGKVYAIEMEDDAIELIKKNKKKFRTDNLEIVKGKAPGSLIDLPVPTHAFIGGSGGSMKDIMITLKEKNPDIVMVINSVTPETTYETLRIIKELELEEIETISVSVSKARTTKNAHLMIAQNPIYMTICRGVGK